MVSHASNMLRLPKLWKTKAQVCFLLATLHAPAHMGAPGTSPGLCPVHCFSWRVPSASFPSTGCNSKHSFQWVLCDPASYGNWGWFGEPPKSAIDVRRKGGLLELFPLFLKLAPNPHSHWNSKCTVIQWLSLCNIISITVHSLSSPIANKF